MKPLDADEPASATKYPAGIWDESAHVITPGDEADVWRVFASEVAGKDGKLVKTTMDAGKDGCTRTAWKAVRQGDVYVIEKTVCRWDRETGAERCWTGKVGEVAPGDEPPGQGDPGSPGTAD